MMERVVVSQGENYDYWNIEELFPASNEQFIQTINLFDYVIWYTDISRETDEHFITAQVAVPQFLNRRRGKVVKLSTYHVRSEFGTQEVHWIYSGQCVK